MSTALPIFQVDAFTRRRFGGNPAAVVLLGETRLPAEVLQQIAAENNLSETAFVSGRGEMRAGRATFGLRWFTPACEVDLCGHATLAAAHVLFSRGLVAGAEVAFSTQSGVLGVARDGERYRLDFPARPPEPAAVTPDVEAALGTRPRELWRSRDMLAVLDAADEVKALRPDLRAVARLDTFAVIVTAPGVDCDFVSRFFAPRAGVDEDPVTGSAHCTLVPYWSTRLGRTELYARQLSARGGELWCRLAGDRVQIAGNAVDYLEGHIFL
ncbi:MAG: PhzF family phenazine biosynthesis protein [Acidobacteriota bacterium]